jgi:hypothetical protein
MEEAVPPPSQGAHWGAGASLQQPHTPADAFLGHHCPYPMQLPDVSQMMTLVDCEAGVMLQNSASVR